MPKRVIDGEALWQSHKLSQVQPEKYRGELANLLPLMSVNGSFEADARLIWSQVYGFNRPKVTLKDVASGEILSYTILGAWDSDLSKGIISYQTAVARALLNHTIGERVELSTDEGGIRHVVIEKIEPHAMDLSIPA